MTVPRCQVLVHLAQTVAQGLIEEPHVHGVILVGSVARSIESADSDVDLAVFIQGTADPFIRTHAAGSTRVEVDTFCIDQIPVGPETPLLTLQDLRDLGRFTTGHILTARGDILNRARPAWQKALLHPFETSDLLATAVTAIEAARGDMVLERIWALQGAASALATLALCLQPIRFQKPKWVMHDLRDAGLADLLGVVRLVYLAGDSDRARAADMLAATEAHLRLGLELGEFPPLVFSPDADHRYNYVYRTFCDAVSLQDDGDHEGVVHTALSSIRLLHTLLKDTSAVPPTCGEEDVARWLLAATETYLTFAEGGLSPDDLQDAADCLRRIAGQIEEEYSRRYRADGPFVIVPENSFRSGLR